VCTEGGGNKRSVSKQLEKRPKGEDQTNIGEISTRKRDLARLYHARGGRKAVC